jgi:hypothetical protein
MISALRRLADIPATGLATGALSLDEVTSMSRTLLIDRVLMVRWLFGRVATLLLSLMHVVVVGAEALSVLVFEEE